VPDQSLARASYALALGKFGPDAEQALPDLRQLATDADPDIRKAAAGALLSIAPPVP
jgi:HEAT repeat protein